jgi:RNA polymerase primary sigma factor
MSFEETKEWFEKYRNGTEKEKKEAFEKICKHNMKLVISMARQYCSTQDNLMDLIQEGNIGLIMAANAFNDSVTCAFSTFATPYIRSAILSAIENDSRLVRRPHNKQEGFVFNDSLDECVEDDEGNGTAKVDLLVSDMGIDDEFDEIPAMLSEALAKLTEVERQIVMKYYGIGTDVPVGYEVLSAEFGKSKEWVRTTHLKALKKMRK